MNLMRHMNLVCWEKMTKAPFTGQSERASDLLGFIHTDVLYVGQRVQMLEETISISLHLLMTLVDMVMFM